MSPDIHESWHVGDVAEFDPRLVTIVSASGRIMGYGLLILDKSKLSKKRPRTRDAVAVLMAAAPDLRNGLINAERNLRDMSFQLAFCGQELKRLGSVNLGATAIFYANSSKVMADEAREILTRAGVK